MIPVPGVIPVIDVNIKGRHHEGIETILRHEGKYEVGLLAQASVVITYFGRDQVFSTENAAFPYLGKREIGLLERLIEHQPIDQHTCGLTARS